MNDLLDGFPASLVINDVDFWVELQLARERLFASIDRRIHRALHFANRSAGQRGRWQRSREARHAQA